MPEWEKYLISLGYKQPRRKYEMTSIEIMKITIFSLSDYQTLQHFYQSYVCRHLQNALPNLVSYNLCIELQKNILISICAYLRQYHFGKVTGISYIDSSKAPV